MSENILSLEDMKFLEILYTKFGLQFIRYDEKGMKINNEEAISKGVAENHENNIISLTEISNKLKFRLDSNFQLNFSTGFNLNVVRL